MFELFYCMKSWVKVDIKHMHKEGLKNIKYCETKGLFSAQLSIKIKKCPSPLFIKHLIGEKLTMCMSLSYNFGLDRHPSPKSLAKHLV